MNRRDALKGLTLLPLLGKSVLLPKEPTLDALRMQVVEAVSKWPTIELPKEYIDYLNASSYRILLGDFTEGGTGEFKEYIFDGTKWIDATRSKE